MVVPLGDEDLDVRGFGWGLVFAASALGVVLGADEWGKSESGDERQEPTGGGGDSCGDFTALRVGVGRRTGLA